MRMLAYLVAILASLSCAAAHAETVCINPKDDPPGPDTTVACYSDAGCKVAESFGAEPIRDYDAESAPFALARGKISAIITTAKDVIKIAEANGAECHPQKP
ncbi:MAG: hypothetical protein QM780_05735 [Hyphomicrobium sp.]|uniref:hypothetical protein n=1 Tax=Hyphomicrobium sp. TaxID=82 RepID=UPI0039E6BD9B